jgi:hypothetical protein
MFAVCENLGQRIEERIGYHECALGHSDLRRTDGLLEKRSEFRRWLIAIAVVVDSLHNFIMGQDAFTTPPEARADRIEKYAHTRAFQSRPSFEQNLSRVS